MAKSIYYCGGCSRTFEVEIERPEEGVPLQTTTCAACGNEHAVKVLDAEELKSGGGCTPGSSC